MKQLLIPCIAGVLAGKMVVDLFAGVGGVSLGIEKGLGRSPDVAVNHCRHKIGVHALNHPATVHLCDDVRSLKPKMVCKGWPVGLLWLSPDCRHFSRAKGSAPVSDSVRSLAMEGIVWADEVRPEVIALENVPEFVGWGPVDENGKPVPGLEGQTFQEFVQALRDRGYVVEWRVLCAADYGAPTTRRRLFLVAWLRPDPIPWPEPTHAAPGTAGAGRLLPWRAAAECIDWSIPCPSIRTRKRPLADATCRRVAKGALKYIINAARPFLVHCAHGEHATRPGGRVNDLAKPLGVVTKTNNHALVAGSLAALRGGEATHQHGDDLGAPLRTISSKGTHHAAISASLIRNFTGMDGGDLQLPVPTITAKDHHSLLAASLVQTGHGERKGQAPRTMSLERPLGTVVSSANNHALSTVFLAHYNTTGGTDQSVADPLHTVTTRARHSLISAEIGENLAGAIWTARFLRRYADDVPVTWLNIGGRLRPVVIVVVDGCEYLLTDLGLRMLEPRELARAQGFPDSYQLTGTKAQQIAGIGNSVCPPVAEALVRALFPRPEPVRKKRAA